MTDTQYQKQGDDQPLQNYKRNGTHKFNEMGIEGLFTKI